ncbi:MAG: AMP-binding protein [Oscillospiraceae bacterium]|jgi:acetyl-CoA synthetase|nr:AMP-binding protein [Oscillospiraceae bacterium]
MPIYEKFTGRHRDDYATLTDLVQNYKLTVPDDFNFAFDCLDEIAGGTPDKLALLWVSNDNEAKRFTYDEIRRQSNRAARFFRAHGIEKGDFVMLTMSRDYRYWPVLMALHRIGAVAVPATYLLTSKDVVYRCNAASVKMILTTPRFGVGKAIEDAGAECPTLKVRAMFGGNVPEGWVDYDAEVSAFSDEPLERCTTASDMMLMAFSSGTTGYPKMVWHDFTYPLGHLPTGCFWHRCEEDGLHFTVSDTGWLKSLWGKMYSQWLAGSAIFVYDFDKFSAPDILQKIQDYRVTTFCAPPTMYRYMIKEDLKSYDLSALTHCTTAGEALNPEVYKAWLGGTGKKIFEGFGQTETTLCCWTGYPWMQPRLGSMGLPAPGYDMIVCDEGGNEVGAGVTGEICIRTPGPAGGARVPGRPYGLFSGYYRDDELTAKVWHDGLYHTGDTAYRDEMGFLWYVGRTDDIIKSSGYRIGPFEVESALMEHPAVTECAVTGVPDPERGFAVKATVVLSKGFAGTPELTKELQDHVKKVTAPYKYPRVIEYVETLPKTISGKIRRVEIREKDGK